MEVANNLQYICDGEADNKYIYILIYIYMIYWYNVWYVRYDWYMIYV